jgi:hypothetical protein
VHSDTGLQAAFRPGLGLGSEIKHDGYRLIVRRDGEAVRLPLKTSGSRIFGKPQKFHGWWLGVLCA